MGSSQLLQQVTGSTILARTSHTNWESILFCPAYLIALLGLLKLTIQALSNMSRLVHFFLNACPIMKPSMRPTMKLRAMMKVMITCMKPMMATITKLASVTRTIATKRTATRNSKSLVRGTRWVVVCRVMVCCLPREWLHLWSLDNQLSSSTLTRWTRSSSILNSTKLPGSSLMNR